MNGGERMIGRKPWLDHADVQALLRSYPDREIVGEGGQKTVFAVEHEDYGPCVLKVGACQARTTLARIKREVDVLTSIKDDRFPTMFEFSEIGGNHFAIFEERLPGRSLEDLIGDFTEPTTALSISRQVVEGLSVLWPRIIHRDIKPANLLVDEEHKVSIIDLGIARLLDEVSLTQTFAARGPCTPVYASPEQLRNLKREINHRCDQFAIGITLAQLLLGGAHPFGPDTVGSGDSVMENILRGDWAKGLVADTCGATTFSLIKRLLSVEPHGRFRSPDMIRRAFRIAEREECRC